MGYMGLIYIATEVKVQSYTKSRQAYIAGSACPFPERYDSEDQRRWTLSRT